MNEKYNLDVTIEKPFYIVESEKVRNLKDLNDSEPMNLITKTESKKLSRNPLNKNPLKKNRTNHEVNPDQFNL